MTTTTITEDTIVLEKTRELCQSIVEQPSFQAMRRQVDTFMANEQAKALYQAVVEKGENLQHKQQMGLTLSNEEISDFEKQRESLLGNPVAKAFLDAQNQMQKLQESVGQYVAKTFELGRLPAAEDMESSCGHGCGCHH